MKETEGYGGQMFWLSGVRSGQWTAPGEVPVLSSQIVIEKKHYSAELLTQRGGWRWGEEQDYNGGSCSVLCCPAV